MSYTSLAASLSRAQQHPAHGPVYGARTHAVDRPGHDDVELTPGRILEHLVEARTATAHRSAFLGLSLGTGITLPEPQHDQGN